MYAGSLGPPYLEESSGTSLTSLTSVAAMLDFYGGREVQGGGVHGQGLG